MGARLLLVSTLLFGLPHGAYDAWLLLDGKRREGQPWGRFFGSVAIYSLLALIFIGVWYVLPNVMLMGFFIFTVWHFGSGDAVWETQSRIDWLLNSFGRGLLVMAAPLAFYPGESGTVLSKLDVDTTKILLSAAPYALMTGIMLVLCTQLFILFHDSQRVTKNRISPWLETPLLLFFFWVTTPLLAITVYFIGVHSWRHLLRLEIYEQRERAFANRNLWQIMRRFHQRTWLMTLISLTGLGLIFWFWQLKISDFANYTSAYLMLLSALTVPHAIFITWTELRYAESLAVKSADKLVYLALQK